MSGVRVRVGAIVLLDQRLLLVQHQKGERAYWLLPGGGLEAGETLFDCAAREVREETGLIVAPERLVFLSESIAPAGGRHILNLLVKANLEGGHLAPPVDDVISEVAWVPLEQVMSLTLHPPIGSALLEAAHHGFAQPLRLIHAPWV